MQNIVFNSVQTYTQKFGTIHQISYDEATNNLVLINNENSLVILEYNPKDNSLKQKQNTSSIDQLQQQNIVLLKYIVDFGKVLCITQKGSIMTIDQNGFADIKAQNQDGIAAASLSPTQQYLYIVTKNSTIVQLDMEFQLINQIPVDEEEQVIPNDPRFTWRPDGNFFVLNVQTKSGRKSVTRDKMMNVFISPAKSDPNPKDPVQSVAEKGRENMESLVAWQPFGGIIAGTDVTQNKHRVIFWQKNGLRHLQFELISSVTKVNELFWSPDSSVLFVDVNQIGQKRVLLFYYRSNYKWHLKNEVILSANQKVISFKTKHNKILLASENGFKLIDFNIQVSRNQWHTKQQQKANPFSLVYCIDGNLLKVSDYAKALIPPPYALHTIDAGLNIIGHSINESQILLFTQQKVFLYKYQQNKIIKSFQNPIKQIIYGVLLINNENSGLKFISNKHFYEQQNGKIVEKQKCTDSDINQRAYKITISTDDSQDKVEIICEKRDSTLIVNDKTITEDCLSYLFYHEFILYTVSTNGMYDKMYIFNLKLDNWIWNENSSIGQKIQQIEQKQKLNIRNVQRGSKILTCSQGRVVFQLPRGNLQGIYPKVIMINEVRKKMQEKQYGKAFEYVRTHRLDLNLIIDLNPENFIANASQILASINRVDYLNLLVSQISQKISTQIDYALTQDQIEQVNRYFDAHLKGKKVKKICQVITKSLRTLNQQKYILSIFTSQIRRGLLNEVLFQIKELRKSDVQVIVPPHIQKNKNNQQKSKKINSQEILEYVCWLVDANYIYEAALLTYDLELAAMTARCTQKDPKQYIPYIEFLKTIQDEVQFKKKICLDLKKYQTAVKQLSLGTETQKKQAIQLVKTHKLYKCGLQTFSKQKQHLYSIKLILIDELLSNGQTNQAYQMAKSINDYNKCLEIAVKNMQTKKIKQCLENMTQLSSVDKIQKAKQILQAIKQGARNKSDLARLYIYVGEYQQATSLYLKAGDYKKFYQYMNKVSQQFIQKELIPGLRLQCSLKKNLLLKDIQLYYEKSTRLLKVQKNKKNQGGQVHTFRNKQNEDMYSQVSVSSKASSYTMSTTTGMRKKKDKKRNILTRNVKQGSLLEEQYLLAYLEDLRSKAEQNIRDSKLLVQHLIYMNLIDEVQQIKNVVTEYIQVMNENKAKSFSKIKFQELHPEASQLYYEEKKNHFTFDSFNYLLEPSKK